MEDQPVVILLNPGQTTLAYAERRLILATLEHFNGDKQKAAQALGISLKTIYNRLHAYAAEDERKVA